MEKSHGTLTIRSYAADEAVPIEGADVTVNGVDNNNQDILFFVSTDMDGLSPKLILPTPNVSYSLTPGQTVTPYSKYDVTVEKSGYYTKRIRDVAIFSGIDALLPINMIPITPGENSPTESNSSTVIENENL